MLAIGAVDRRRNLRGDRLGGGRRSRCRGARCPRRCWPGARALVPAARRGLRAGRALLRRTGRDDSAGGQRVRLFVRHARRNRRVDHRLGPDPRVRRRQRGGRDLVVGLLQVAAERMDRIPRLAHDRLPNRPAVERCGGAWLAPHGAAPVRHPDPDQRSGLRDRDADHRVAADGRAGERHGEQHHGRHQTAGARSLHRDGDAAHQPGELPPVHAQRVPRRRTRAPRSSSSPTSGSTRSRPRRRKRRTRNGTCRSASSAGWRSAP